MKPNQLLALMSLTVLACEQGRQSAPFLLVQPRDSAGIWIVENEMPLDGTRLPWRISPEPIVSIGAVAGEEPYLLDGVAHATQLSDGRIVVANRGTSELRVFDGRGVHLATWGGRGDGPGEFSELMRVEPWRGDSIIAWHAPRLGLSIFDTGGDYGRRLEFVHDPATLLHHRFWPQQVTRDGSILAVHMPEGADTVVVQLRDGEGRVRSEFGSHAGWEPYIHAEGTDRSMLFRKIFGRDPVWTSWGELVVIGHTGRYELRAFAVDGSLERIVRRGHVPRSPTPAEVQEYIDGQLAWTSTMPGSQPERWRRAYEAVPVAEHFPAFKSIMSDAVDHLWVEEYDSVDPQGEYEGPRLWTVFDPQGRMLGLFETPEGLWIDEVGEDYILGTSRDELNVEYVEVWGLERLAR